MTARKLASVPETGGNRASPNQLTIEQLSQETRLSVRNIRSHQARGLLPPPEVRVRVGYYGPEHVARLRLIQELQAEGFNLKGIKRLLDETHTATARLLDVKRAVDSAAEGEPPEIVTAEQLAGRFGVDEEEGEKLLAKALKLGILVPVGGGHFEVPNPSLLDAAEEVLRRGISLAHALEIVEELARHSRAVAQRLVKLFVEDVWKPFAEAGMPEAQWAEIADSIEQTRPLATQALVAVFQQAMSKETEAALTELTKRLAEGKR